MVPDSNQVGYMCKWDKCNNAFFSILKINIYYVELYIVVQSGTAVYNIILEISTVKIKLRDRRSDKVQYRREKNESVTQNQFLIGLDRQEEEWM